MKSIFKHTALLLTILFASHNLNAVAANKTRIEGTVTEKLASLRYSLKGNYTTTSFTNKFNEGNVKPGETLTFEIQNVSSAKATYKTVNMNLMYLRNGKYTDIIKCTQLDGDGVQSNSFTVDPSWEMIAIVGVAVSSDGYADLAQTKIALYVNGKGAGSAADIAGGGATDYGDKSDTNYGDESNEDEDSDDDMDQSGDNEAPSISSGDSSSDESKRKSRIWKGVGVGVAGALAAGGALGLGLGGEGAAGAAGGAAEGTGTETPIEPKPEPDPLPQPEPEPEPKPEPQPKPEPEPKPEPKPQPQPQPKPEPQPQTQPGNAPSGAGEASASPDGAAQSPDKGDTMTPEQKKYIEKLKEKYGISADSSFEETKAIVKEIMEGHIQKAEEWNRRADICNGLVIGGLAVQILADTGMAAATKAATLAGMPGDIINSSYSFVKNLAGEGTTAYIGDGDWNKAMKKATFNTVVEIGQTAISGGWKSTLASGAVGDAVKAAYGAGMDGKENGEILRDAAVGGALGALRSGMSLVIDAAGKHIAKTGADTAANTLLGRGVATPKAASNKFEADILKQFFKERQAAQKLVDGKHIAERTGRALKNLAKDHLVNAIAENNIGTTAVNNFMGNYYNTVTSEAMF